jgi:dihydropyrimidinase
MGYHIAVTDLKEGGSLEELASLPDQGITSYKLFMAYKGALMVDDETLFKTMEVAAETKALVMVHAENGDAIDVLVKKALAGKTEPKYHALTRPPETEGEATNRAIQLARVAGCSLYVVHVSCQESVEPIMLAREKGWDVWGETCTQYFFVDYTFLERPNFEGAKYVYTPPPRDRANQDVLWDAVRRDTLSVISTDHCAFRWDSQKSLGKDDFSKIPNGGPGLENRLHMIHHFGVREGRIDLNRMVELLCTNPAKLFGLYPRKGTVAVGSDADLVIFDPEKRHTITAANQQSKTDYNLYEGTEVVGDVETVLLRGNVLVEGGEVVAKPGIGSSWRGRGSASSSPRPERRPRPRRSAPSGCVVEGTDERVHARVDAVRIRVPGPDVQRHEVRCQNPNAAPLSGLVFAQSVSPLPGRRCRRRSGTRREGAVLRPGSGAFAGFSVNTHSNAASCHDLPCFS